MPRRKNTRANPPAAAYSVYDETKPKPPKPLTCTDKKGRVWSVDFLRLRSQEKSYATGVYPWDSTHLGFTYAPIGGELHQRVYRFQRGESRELTPEAIYTALAASKRVQSHAEHAHKKLLERLSKAPEPTRIERIQELYGKRGMGRR